jgi:hypothetical protein
MHCTSPQNNKKYILSCHDEIENLTTKINKQTNKQNYSSKAALTLILRQINSATQFLRKASITTSILRIMIIKFCETSFRQSLAMGANAGDHSYWHAGPN